MLTRSEIKTYTLNFITVHYAGKLKLKLITPFSAYFGKNNSTVCRHYSNFRSTEVHRRKWNFGVVHGLKINPEVVVVLPVHPY